MAARSHIDISKTKINHIGAIINQRNRRPDTWKKHLDRFLIESEKLGKHSSINIHKNFLRTFLGSGFLS
jgi:hypothetical protein